MKTLVIPIAGHPPSCDLTEAITWPVGDLGLSRTIGNEVAVSCRDLSRVLCAATTESAPLVRYFLSGPCDDPTGPRVVYIEIRPEEALQILFSAGWSDRLPRDLSQLLADELLGEEVPNPLDRDLRLFSKMTTRLQAMLLRRLAIRDVMLINREDNSELTTEWERLEAESIQGLQIAYREARRLKLETDPAPLLSAFFPVDDEGDAPSMERCLDTLLALGLDAQARIPDPSLGEPKPGPNEPATVEASEAEPFLAQDLVTLDQAAASVHKSKRTLERYKTRGQLPDPVIEGGGGKADLYEWRTLRPWLTEVFGIRLPVKFPR